MKEPAADVDVISLIPLASKEEQDTNEYRTSAELEKQQLNFFLSKQGKYLRRRT